MERAGKGNRVISRLHVILIFSARRRSTRHRALRSGGGCRKITEAAALKSKKIPKLAAYIYIYIYIHNNNNAGSYNRKIITRHANR